MSNHINLFVNTLKICLNPLFRLPLVNEIINIIKLIVKKINFYFFYFVTIFLFNSPTFIAI